MSSLAETPSTEPEAQFAVRGTKVAVGACLLLLLFVVLIFGLAAGILRTLFFSSPLWLPHLWILWRLRHAPHKGLAFAIGFGLGVFFLAYGLVVVVISRSDIGPFGMYDLGELVAWLMAFILVYFWLFIGLLIVFAPLVFAHLALAVIALTAYWKRWGLALLAGAVPPLLVMPLILLIAFINVSPRSSPRHVAVRPLWSEDLIADEYNAIRVVQELNAAASTYEATYGNGYPPSLDVLKPPPPGSRPSCRAAGLSEELGSWPLSVNTSSGYFRDEDGSGHVFTYIPGPPVDRPVPGCPPGAESYTFTARPKPYNEAGIRSYFTTQYGKIHYTNEDRPATAEDYECWGDSSCAVFLRKPTPPR